MSHYPQQGGGRMESPPAYAPQGVVTTTTTTTTVVREGPVREVDCSALGLNLRANYLAVAVVLTATMLVSTVLALSVPQWIVTEHPAYSSQGLFRRCTTLDGCEDNTYPAYFISGSCAREGAEFRDRVRATAALVIIGLILNFGVVVNWALHVVGFTDVYSGGCHYLAVTAASALAAASYLAGIIIYGASVNHWLYCDKKFCDVVAPGNTSECGFGFSFSMAIVALVLTLFVTAGGVAGKVKGPPAQGAIRLEWWLTILGSIAFVSGIMAAATPHWMAINTNRTSIGLWRSCNGATCRDLAYPAVMSTTATCNRDGKVYQQRNNAAAAFVIIALALSFFLFVLFFLSFLKKLRLQFSQVLKWAVAGAIMLAGLSAAVALIIVGHTYSSWYLCGRDFCEGVKGCNWGFGFACAVIASVAAFLLFWVQLCEANSWLCFAGRTAGDPFGGASEVAAVHTTHSHEREPSAVPPTQQPAARPAPYAAAPPQQPPQQPQPQQQQRGIAPAAPPPNRPAGGAGASVTARGGPPPPAPAVPGARPGGASSGGAASAGSAPPSVPVAPAAPAAPAAGRAAAARTVRTNAGKTVTLPAGDWEYDAVSKYYWSDERQLFWDAESVMYHDPKTERWFK